MTSKCNEYYVVNECMSTECGNKPEGDVNESVSEVDECVSVNEYSDEKCSNKQLCELNESANEVSEVNKEPHNEEYLSKEDYTGVLLYDVNGMCVGESVCEGLMIQESSLHRKCTMYMDTHPAIRLCEYVRNYGEPNVFGARVPVNSGWNLDLLDSLLENYEDREMIQFMRYGWPANRIPNMPAPTINRVNHSSTVNNPEFVHRYLVSELLVGASIGPFGSIPFKTGNVGVSPLSTRPKRNSTDRRIILDLSFPPGASVNDWTSKDNYMGLDIKLRFPGVDDLACRIVQLGVDCRCWKHDLKRCFRQMPLCPGSYPLFGFIWEGLLYWDTVLVMGHRISPYICQRITDALRYVHTCIGYFLLNYVDDFIGADLEVVAQKSYDTFGRLLSALGVQEATTKAVPPSTIIEFLGVGFDVIKQVMFVTEDRMVELADELDKWYVDKLIQRKDQESLIGKLQFVTSCVRPGRVFISRLLNELRGMGQESVRVLEQIMLDLEWWKRILPEYNGVSILWLECCLTPDSIVSSDACLTGIGGMLEEGEYYYRRLPSWLVNDNIAHLEMWAIIISLKVWGEKLSGKRIVMKCDNEAMVSVLNTGKARDKFLQAAMREVVYLLARFQVELRCQFIRGLDNQKPDLLSRWYEGGVYHRGFHALSRDKSWKHVKPKLEMFTFVHVW